MLHSAVIISKVSNLDRAYLVASSVVRNSKNEILFLKRSARSAYANYWQLPEGKIEKGEDIEPALIREIQEETNLKTNKLLPLFHQHDSFKVKNIKIVFLRFIYKAEVEGKIKISHEHSGYVWMSKSKAIRTKNLVPGLREILKNL